MARRPSKQRGGGFEPTSLTAYERYEALSPILSRATKAYMRLYSQRQTAARREAVNSQLTDMFARVSSTSGMSVEETRRAFHGFLVMGWPGLMTPIPVSAEQIAANFKGTWELVSRFTNGGHTPLARGDTRTTRARSHIYFHQSPDDPTELIELQTMWNEENHYARDEAVKRFFDDSRSPDRETFLIAALMRTRLRQVDPYTVEYSNEGEMIGNHAHYREPINFAGRVNIGSFDGQESMLSLQDTCEIRQAGKSVPVTGMFLLLNVHGGARSIAYTMSGMPPMQGDERTMDVVDNYVKISDQQPLIGGWEPVEDYYARTREHFIGARPRRELLAHFDVDAVQRGTRPI